MMSKLTFESKEGHRQAEMSVMTSQAESTTNIEALRWTPVGDGDDQTGQGGWGKPRRRRRRGSQGQVIKGLIARGRSLECLLNITGSNCGSWGVGWVGVG